MTYPDPAADRAATIATARLVVADAIERGATAREAVADVAQALSTLKVSDCLRDRDGKPITDARGEPFQTFRSLEVGSLGAVRHDANRPSFSAESTVRPCGPDGWPL